MYTIENLLEKIDVFSSLDDDDAISEYTEMEVIDVDQLTEKAALITCEGNDAIWIPLSLMKCNDTKSIFVETWFYNKNF